MDLEAIDKTLEAHIAEYDRSLNGIRQCVAAYETKCREIISEIATSSSEQKVDELFERLQNIQEALSSVLYKREIEIGGNLRTLTKEFDRLHDPYIRDYWLKRFRNGERWPV